MKHGPNVVLPTQSIVPNQPGDYIIVYFLDEQTVGKRFAKKRNNWPLHVTLLPWFYTDDERTVRSVLALSAACSPPLQIMLGEEEQFNPDTRVSVASEQSGLAALHTALLMTLEEAGVHLRNTQWTGEHYKAHVTHHAMQPIPKAGDVHHVADFSLVKLLPGNMCEILQHFKFGAET